MKPKMVRDAQHDQAPVTVLLRDATEAPSRPAAGIAAGSTILTLDGEMPVEFLSVGDRIITRDSGIATLKAITPIKSDAAYRIKASVLGHDRPQSDLLVAAGQRILLRDWRAKALYGVAEALVPVERLADGESISRETGRSTAFFALEFDAPHILYVDGVELASAEPALIDA
jgi:hypothetical protein